MNNVLLGILAPLTGIAFGFLILEALCSALIRSKWITGERYEVSIIKIIRNAPHWFWIIGIASLMRLPILGLDKFWFDEAFTWLAAKPGSNMWQAIIGDDHPPLWTLIQALNERLLGGSEFAFRLPAAILGIACVWLVWRIAIELKLDRKTAFVAGILAALMPGAIYVSQDGRMYALFGFAVLVALLAVMRSEWWLFSIAGVVLVYTQNTGVMYVFALGLTALLIYRKARPIHRKASVWAIARIVLAWIPWVPVLLFQTEALKTAFWESPLTPVNSLFPILQTTMGFRVPQSLQIITYGVGLGLTAIGLWVSRPWLFISYKPLFVQRTVQDGNWSWYEWMPYKVYKRYIPTDNALLYLSVVFGGPLMMALVSIALGRSIYVYRPMIASGMLLALPWAYALMHLKPDNRLVARIVAVVAFAFALYGHFTGPRQDALAWVQPIVSRFRAGDAVFFTQATSEVLYGHYLPASIPQFVRYYDGDLLALTGSTQEAFHFARLQSLHDLVSLGYKRAFIVVTMTPLTRRDELDFIDDMDAHYTLTTLHRDDVPGLGYEAIYETVLQ